MTHYSQWSIAQLAGKVPSNQPGGREQPQPPTQFPPGMQQIHNLFQNLKFSKFFFKGF